jgi:hypothetical protein
VPGGSGQLLAKLRRMGNMNPHAVAWLEEVLDAMFRYEEDGE